VLSSVRRRKIWGLCRGNGLDQRMLDPTDWS
jgi:hypothetical protein